jgi:hypothetical protein
VTVTVGNLDGLVTSVRVAGELTVLGEPSSSQRLPLGLSSIDIDITARGDLAMTYRVVIERGKGVVEQAVYGKASNTGRNDSFGRALAVSANTLAVGAPAEDSRATGVNGNQSDDGASNAGAVYVFLRSGSAWTQQAYVKASDTQNEDGFGTSVALSGDTLLVGAAGRSGSRGAVYVFRRIDGTWAQQAALVASNGEVGDGFGWSVALSEDTLAVSAPGEASSATGVNGNQQDNSASAAGAVYVFQRTGTIWSQQAYIKASNTDRNDQFGSSLALSGNTVAVGAPADASPARGVNGDQLDNVSIFSGAVYVFQRTGTVWAQQAYVKASNSAPLAQFGTSLALSEDTLAVGARGEASSATGIDGNQSDGSALVSGAVYVFHRTGSTWAQQTYIKASNTEAQDAFGSSVALSGELLAVSALGEDSAAEGGNGNQMDNSAPDAGAIYLFKRVDGTWSQDAYLKSSNIEMADSLGSALALAPDTLVAAAVGEDGGEIGLNRNEADNRAQDSGAIYVFR